MKNNNNILKIGLPGGLVNEKHSNKNLVKNKKEIKVSDYMIKKIRNNNVNVVRKITAVVI